MSLKWLREIRLWWVMCALLALAVLAGPVARQRLDPVHVKDGNARLPTGYADIVQRLIDVRGEPLIEIERDRGDAGDDSALISGKIALTPAGLDFEKGKLRRFVAQSYLQNDMASLDPAVWRTDSSGGRLTGVFGSAHLLRGPYDQGENWTGEISYREPSTPRFILMAGDVPVAELATRLGANDGREALFTEHKAVGEGVRAIPTTGTIRFMSGEAVASLWRVGDRLLLRVPASANVEVLVDGKVVRPRTGRVGRVELPIGASLAFRDTHGPRRSDYVIRQQIDSISRVIPGRGRERDPLLASISQPIEAAMAEGGRNIALTIDSRIQTAAQRQLTATGRRILPSERVSFRGAATLMEGDTGEIRALASFPAVPLDLTPAERKSPARLRLLEQNQNFVALPIGSTAKVPFAAAILKERPELLSMSIGVRPAVDGKFKYRTLMGFDLGGSFEDHGPGGINLPQFIATSSNRFAAMLMLLGLKRDSNAPSAQAAAWYAAHPTIPSDTFRYGSTGYKLPPRFSVFGDADWRGAFGAVPRRDNEIEDVWTHNLEDLFGLGYFAAGSENMRAADAASSRLWTGLNAAHPWLLLPVVPDRESFMFDRVNDIGSDYVMSILGGNRSRWSTIRLAEAYSRLIANQRVDARLIPLRGRRQIVPLDLDNNIRESLMTGMRGVFRGGGTGAPLVNDPRFPAALRQGLASRELWVMGKTGTPNVVREGMATESSLALTAFAERETQCDLHLSRYGRLLVGRGGDVVAELRACSPGIGDRAQLIADEIDTLNNTPERRRGLRADRDGRVRNIASNAEAVVAETGKVMVFSVVRLIHEHGKVKFCAIRTIAINYQARGSAVSEPARQAMLDMIGEPAILAWLTGPCPGAAQ